MSSRTVLQSLSYAQSELWSLCCLNFFYFTFSSCEATNIMVFFKIPNIGRGSNDKSTSSKGSNKSTGQEGLADFGSRLDNHLAKSKTQYRSQARRGRRGRSQERPADHSSPDNHPPQPSNLETVVIPDHTDSSSTEDVEGFLGKLVSELQRSQDTTHPLEDVKDAENECGVVITKRKRRTPRRHRSTSLKILRETKETMKTAESKPKRSLRRHRSYNQVVASSNLLAEIRTKPRRHKSNLGRPTQRLLVEKLYFDRDISA